jgi:hypothetical protein
VALAVGVFLVLPSLLVGYFADDWLLLHDLETDGGGLGAAARLYRFSLHWHSTPDEPAAMLPWWMSPSYQTDFVRPLAGALFWIDTRLWPGGGALAHLHSVAWFLLVLVGAGALLRRWLPPPAALLALLIFAIDDAHWMPVAWLASRHGAVAAAAVFAGIWAHLRWRDDGWRAGLPLSLAAYAVGLAAGESALQALAYLYGDELFGTGKAEGRWRRLLPVTALLFAYGALRRPLGAMVEGSGIYFDPLVHPLRFLGALPTRLAMLLGDLIGGMPSDLWFPFPELEPLLVVVGLGVMVLVGWVLARLWRRLPPSEARPLRGILAGGLLALLPGAAGLPGSRLLLIPSLAAAVLAATLIRAPTVPRVVRGWLVAVHLVLAPLVLIADQVQAISLAQRMPRIAAESDLTGDLVVIGTPDALLSIYPPYLEWASGRRRTRSYHVLSFAPRSFVLERIAEREVRLVATDGRFLDTPQERLLRDRALVDGERFTQPGLTVTSESPTSLRFAFDQSADALNFVAWKGGAFRHLALPPPGGRVTIPHEPGVMGF